MSSQTIELAGQCKTCLDLFTVEFFPVRRAAKPGMRYYRPFLTNRLVYRGGRLLHRPGVCGGTVKLYGRLSLASYNGKHKKAHAPDLVSKAV